MHVITRRRLNEFGEKHPEAKASLGHWYRLMKHHQFASFSELRALFPPVDHVRKLTAFNLGGNKACLIAAINYNHRRTCTRDAGGLGIVS